MICDKQTDGQTDARGKTICLPTLKGEDIITGLLSVRSCRVKANIITIICAIVMVMSPTSQLPVKDNRFTLCQVLSGQGQYYNYYLCHCQGNVTNHTASCER